MGNTFSGGTPISPFKRRLLIGFAACGLLSFVYAATHAQPRLTIQMSSSRFSTAQLYYDDGHGFSESASETASVAATSPDVFQTLSFELPRRKLYRLRFDPLMCDGDVAIRSILIENRGSVIQKISPAAVTPLNEIAKISQHDGTVNLTLQPGAIDPGVNIVLANRLHLRWVLSGNGPLLLGVNAGLAGVCLLIAFQERNAPRARDALVAANRRVDLLARRLPAADFFHFDGLAIWFYTGLLIVFAAASALNLNGSSAAMYSRAYHLGPRVETFLGQAQPIRSDEWAYVTPDILNQYQRANRFEAKTSVLGSHFVALTGNVPVNDISTLFRPQFWGFFALPLSYAFAVYWQAKALILLAGVFTFLLWITASSFWALAGALWYFFSPFTQWSYSWPSALPEMIGTICLGTVFACYLLVGRDRLMLAVAALGLAFCAIDFTMCAYPPHLIPLFLLGVAIACAWCWAARKEILNPTAAASRVPAILFALVLISLVGWNVHRELAPAIQAVAHTAYPGQRVATGGSMPIWWLGSHFLQWTEAEGHFPSALANLSEGSGFLWLAPLTLLCLPRLSPSRFQRAALIALWLNFLLLLCWMVLPLPTSFGHVLGLHLVPAARCLPAAGLANIALVVLAVSVFRKKPPPQFGNIPRVRNLVTFLAAFAVFGFISFETNQKLHGFFTWKEMAAGSAFAALLAFLLLTARSRAFAFCLIIPQAFAFGTINPIERGLPVFLDSQLTAFVRSHPALLRGEWLIYSGTVVSSGFFAATGCQVYTGTHYIPDIDHFALFQKRGLDVQTLNRLGYLNAMPLASGRPTYVEKKSDVLVEWHVAPDDPLLREIGVLYVAFDRKPANTQGLSPLANTPVDGFWLYQLNPRPSV